MVPNAGSDSGQGVAFDESRGYRRTPIPSVAPGRSGTRSHRCSNSSCRIHWGVFTHGGAWFPYEVDRGTGAANGGPGQSASLVTASNRSVIWPPISFSAASPPSPFATKDVKRLAAAVSERIKAERPGVRWKDSWATTGHFDVVDVVESDDPKQVTRAAMIIHAHGHATTETALATPWKEFLASL